MAFQISRRTIFGAICLFLIIIVKTILIRIENSMIFRPNKLLPKSEIGLEYYQKVMNKINPKITIDELFIKSKNKNKINMVVMINPEFKNHIIYCHGNAGNIKSRLDLIPLFGKYGSLTLFDYQGYGKSEGFPSEENLYNDAFSVWKYLVNKRKINPKNITIYGKSLGGAVASKLANMICNEVDGDHVNPHSLIIESSFSSVPDMVKDIFSIPLDILISNKFNSKKNLEEVNGKTKVLIAHSPNDEMIGLHHGKELYRNCKNYGGNFIEISGSHNNINYNNQFIKNIQDYLKD